MFLNPDMRTRFAGALEVSLRELGAPSTAESSEVSLNKGVCSADPRRRPNDHFIGSRFQQHAG